VKLVGPLLLRDEGAHLQRLAVLELHHRTVQGIVLPVGHGSLHNAKLVFFGFVFLKR
jgi:hypothetical protein